jgi:hypothetical protein
MNKTPGAVAAAYKDYQRAIHDHTIAENVLKQINERVEMVGSVLAEMMFKERDIIVGTVLHNAGYMNKGDWVVAAFHYRSGLFAAQAGKAIFENAVALCFNMRKNMTVGKRTCSFPGLSFTVGGLDMGEGKKFAELSIKSQPDTKESEENGTTERRENSVC